MKQRIGIIAVSVVAVAVTAFIYSQVREELPHAGGLEKPAERWRDHEGQFPELQPIFDVPDGYDLKFKDGPDFYTWTLSEREMVERGIDPELAFTLGITPTARWEWMRKNN